MRLPLWKTPSRDLCYSTQCSGPQTVILLGRWLLPSLLYYFMPFRYVYKKHLIYYEYMKIEIAFTQEEYAAILRAMESAGFTDVADYLRHAVLQAVYNELSGR